jgi:hypothetical protein
MSMKNLTICLLITTVLFSCSKSTTTPTTPPAGDSLLKSFSIYQPLIQTKTVVVVSYDQNKLIASLFAHNYDSSGGTVAIDSTLFSFTQTDTITLPGSYDLTFYNPGTPPSGSSEHHLLFYDNQNRVTGDSVTVNQTNNFTTQHFTYDGFGNTTIESFSFDPLTAGSNVYLQIDTMNMSQNNLLTDIAYATPGGQLVHLISRSFTTDLNPLYNAHLANNLGTVITYNSLLDFKSINLPNQFSYQDGNFQIINLNFVWTKDAAGRVVQGIGSDPNSGVPGQIYTFTY